MVREIIGRPNPVKSDFAPFPNMTKMNLVNTVYERRSIHQIRDYLTVGKYIPKMSKTVNKNDRDMACLVFGEQKAIELGLASPRKLSGGVRQPRKKSHLKNSSKKPLISNFDPVTKMANKRQRTLKGKISV